MVVAPSSISVRLGGVQAFSDKAPGRLGNAGIRQPKHRWARPFKVSRGPAHADDLRACLSIDIAERRMLASSPARQPVPGTDGQLPSGASGFSDRFSAITWS